jgi:hypothetical protein
MIVEFDRVLVRRLKGLFGEVIPENFKRKPGTITEVEPVR